MINAPAQGLRSLHSLKLLLALLVIGCSFLISEKTQAQTTLDSAVTDTGLGVSVDFGNPNFPDSLMASGITTSDTVTIISSTTPYTILSFGVTVKNAGDGYELLCNGVNLLPDSAGLGNGAWLPTYMINSYNGQLHCSGDLEANFPISSIGQIWVQYVPYDTRAIIPNVPLQDTHFVIIAGFLTALASMIFIVSLFRKRI